MTVTQQQRHLMIDRLAASIGHEATGILMEFLPPVGWADAATERDLDALERRTAVRFGRVDDRFTSMEQRLDERFARIDDRIGALRDELLAAFRGELVTAVSGQTRHVITATAMAVFGIGGLAVTIAQALP